jgi:hypothetical protein
VTNHIFISYVTNEPLKAAENLPDPDLLTQEIVENLESALMQFESIVEELGKE